MKICQNCGTEVSDTAKFCRKCGSKIEAAPEAAPEAAAPDMDVNAGEAEAAPGMEAIPDMHAAPNTDAAPGIDAAAADAKAGPAPEEKPAAHDQPLGMGAGTAEFIGKDYQWGPPTGGENYDEPAMPAVFVGDAEDEAYEEAAEPQESRTYQLEAPSYDHTEEFDPEDISENKVTALAAYLLGPLGIIIALLAGKDSPYAAFHMRQGLKIVEVQALLLIITVLLCWTLIVPVAATICFIILCVVQLVAIVSVCKGKAVEPAIIRSLRFLK